MEGGIPHGDIAVCPVGCQQRRRGSPAVDRVVGGDTAIESVGQADILEAELGKCRLWDRVSKTPAPHGATAVKATGVIRSQADLLVVNRIGQYGNTCAGPEAASCNRDDCCSGTDGPHDSLA